MSPELDNAWSTGDFNFRSQISERIGADEAGHMERGL